MRDPVPDRTEAVQLLLLGPFRLGRVVKRPIEGLECEGIEARTMRLLLVTHDNGILDVDLAENVVEALGPQPAWVQAGFGQTWRVRGWTSVGARPALRTSKRSPA